MTTTDIDDLFRDTALFVVALNHNGHADQGQALYQRGVSLVEQLKTALQAAKISAESTEHILYAQCALLDETVLNRTITREDTTAGATDASASGQMDDREIAAARQEAEPASMTTTAANTADVHARSVQSDSGYQTWIVTPLQARFFGALNAGEMLLERMRQVLSQPASDPLVLACFQRVLALGFQGRYRERPGQTGELQALQDALTQRAGLMTLNPQAANLLSRRALKGRFWCRRSLLFWSSCGVVGVALVWLVMHQVLARALITWLPG